MRKILALLVVASSALALANERRKYIISHTCLKNIWMATINERHVDFKKFYPPWKKRYLKMPF